MTLTTLQLFDSTAQVTLRQAGGGAPLVLIHGVGLQSAAWGPQIEAFAQTHRVLAIDMPGHGGSTPLPEGGLLPDFVQWCADVMETLGFEQVSIAGHSMGALIVAGYAATHPDRVSHVALLNGVFRRTPAASQAVQARAAEITAGKIDLETPLDRWFGTSAADRAARDQTGGWLRAVNPKSYATAYTAFAHGDATYADRFDRISCPLLALTGEGDPNSTPDMARAMAAAAPQGTAVSIKGHRHMAHLTASDEVNKHLRTWLDTPIAATAKELQ